MAWKRSQSLEFPSTWIQFTAPDLDGKTIVNYRIQDVPYNRHNEIIDFMFANHLPYEPVLSAKGILGDAVSQNEMKMSWSQILKQNVSLVCFKEHSNEIIGVNIVGVLTKADSDKPSQVKGRALSEVLKSKHYLKTTYFNPFKYYEVDKILNAYGLTVKKEYSQRGIATQLLLARIELIRAIDIEVTSNIFTSLGAQKAAEKAGYSTQLEIMYSTLAEENTDSIFPGIKENCLKIMSKKISPRS